MDAVPVVDVIREGAQFVFVDPCPFCGDKHRHGAPAVGLRVANCSPYAGLPKPCYELREVDRCGDPVTQRL